MCRSLAFMYSLGLGLLSPVAGGAQTTVISPRGIGPLQLCEKLSRVTTFFPQARDTLMSGEGDSQWASKIAHLPGSTRITFESSWVDSAHVWRISTNSPAYHTPRGYAVGTLVSALVAKGEKLQFEYPEGFLVITAGDSVPFLVDDASAIAFFRRDYQRAPLQALDPNARIKELFVSGDCRGKQ